ncbi:MAG TPA: rhodanese-like domain-containing protein [Ohtaekwangia sp.]|nr:rhodanese-like domain-containing protein [Ohtaekwangia sp.]
MKKIFLAATVLLLSLIASAQQHPVLVDAQWLSEHAKDPDIIILQVNWLKLDYEREHIPGARHLWPGWLAPDSPEGNFNAPDPEKATAILQQLGISNNSHIVICHVRTEVTVAARMFLTLEHLGLAGQVSFLNGGQEAWKLDGNPVTSEVPEIKKGKFKARPGALIVDKDYVLKTLGSDKGVVVDARVKRFYDGDPTGNPRDGHISGARNIPYPEMMNKTNMFKPADSLQAYFMPVATKEKEVVTYCFIGQTASVVYMAGRILGYNMKLYDGSLQEWSRIDTLPMEKTQP